MIKKSVLQKRLAAVGQAQGGPDDPGLLQRWARIRDRWVFEALDRDLSHGVEVRPEEIERHYQKHPERFASPEKISTQLILLRLPSDAASDVVQAAIEQLRGVRKQYLAGTSFGKLAREHSQAENAARGGIVAARPRGSLLPEFEKVAWELKPGEVSDVVRLPDGVALILLNKRLEARQRSLEEARKTIKKRLRHEKIQLRRETALAKVCSPWPPQLDGELAAETVLLHSAGKAVRLQDIEVDRHRPRWREALQASLENLCLQRLAAEHGIEKRPEIADKLRHHRARLLASFAMDQRLAENPPKVADEQLMALYDQHRKRFEIPEQRTFEVVMVAGAEGQLRPARAQAQAAMKRWRDAGKLQPTDGQSRELWGPIPQTQLADLTSPVLARQAFALKPGEISEPLRLERYAIERSRFEPKGYVVLRLRSIEPRNLRPFEEARGPLLHHATRDQVQQQSDEIRRDVLLKAELRVDREALASCQLPAGRKSIQRRP